MRDLAVDVDALGAELGERRPQAPLGLGVLGARRIALRRDDQEARAPFLRTRADALEERLRENGLVRDDEDVRPGLDRRRR